MRVIRVLPLVLALLLLFSACSPTPPKDDFAYAAAPFTATVRGTYTPSDGAPRPIAAEITVGAPFVGDTSAARPLSITFTAPTALAGITVTAAYKADTAGNPLRTVTFTYPSPYGEVKTSSDGRGVNGFLRFAEALLPIGDVVSVSPTAEDGTHTVTRTTADGAREAVFLFSAEQAPPLRVRVRDEGEVLELVITP